MSTDMNVGEWSGIGCDCTVVYWSCSQGLACVNLNGIRAI